MDFNKGKYYIAIIRNEKVGCSIHLSGTNTCKKPCYLVDSEVFCFVVDVTADAMSSLNLSGKHGSLASRLCFLVWHLAGLDGHAHDSIGCSILPKHFIDLLTLIHTDGRWQVISKVFHYELEAPTTAQ